MFFRKRGAFKRDKDLAAGFSLGELSALTYAKSADFDTMFTLVCRRGELMQEAAERTPASMAAVVKLTAEQVEEICRGFSQVYPVNFNCPGQISVSGKAEEMADFGEAVKQAELFKSSLEAPKLPVYGNRTALPYPEDGQAAKDLLASQIVSPVQWERTVRNLIADGADTFVELGPGETLAGMIKRIDKNVRTFAVSDMAGLEAVKTEVAGC